ncbi:MAG TPA: hypothetical protein VNQ90_02910 [Chthoniobacteraceae bacterium]|nr:hypothetical protein [Chthoniobacteraceae bacterium]
MKSLAMAILFAALAGIVGSLSGCATIERDTFTANYHDGIFEFGYKLPEPKAHSK